MTESNLSSLHLTMVSGINVASRSQKCCRRKQGCRKYDVVAERETIIDDFPDATKSEKGVDDAETYPAHPGRAGIASRPVQPAFLIAFSYTIFAREQRRPQARLPLTP